MKTNTSDNVLTSQIACYGAGTLSKTLLFIVGTSGTADCSYRVVCFMDDNGSCQGHEIKGVPVLSVEAAKASFPQAKVVAAIGQSRAREAVIKNAEAVGFEFATIIHPTVIRTPWLTIGLGSVVFPGSIISADVTLGKHVQVNFKCTIGHDSVLEDFATLAPGVQVSGWVRVGRRAQIGVGAVIINGSKQAPLHIGEDAVIGAGACVTRPVAAGQTVAGVPAIPLKGSKNV